jgi:hypothetical protein
MRRIGRPVLAVALVGAALIAGSDADAGANAVEVKAPPPCTFDYCVDEEVLTLAPAAPGSPTDPGPRQGNNSPPPACVWVHWQSRSQNSFPLIPDPPSGDAELYLEECNGVGTGRAQWVPPGSPAPGPAPMSAADLAQAAYVRLEGTLPSPEVSSNPGPGVAAIVGFPSFVVVDNWSGTVTDRECDPNFPLCVTVTAVPSLSWAPGEPGAEPVPCSGPGTRFDPAGAEPEVQATAAGACAYEYELRTGVAGRPEEWPGEVSVVWALTWASTTGSGGLLPSVTKSAPVPRAVDEVQTIVESAG